MNIIPGGLGSEIGRFLLTPLLAFIRRTYLAIERTHRVRLWISAVVLLPLLCLCREEPSTYNSLAFDDNTSRRSIRLVAMKQNDTHVIVEVNEVDFTVPQVTDSRLLVNRKRKQYHCINKLARDASDFYYFQANNAIYKISPLSYKIRPVAKKTEKDTIFDVDINNIDIGNAPTHYPWLNQYIKIKHIEVDRACLSPSKQLLSIITRDNDLLIIDLKNKTIFPCELSEYTKIRICDLVFASNDQLLIIGDTLGVLSYNIKHNKVSRLLGLSEKPNHLQSLEQDRYAVSTADNNIIVFQAENGKTIWQKHLDDVVTCMAYSKAQKCLATGGNDIRLMNLSSVLSQRSQE